MPHPILRSAQDDPCPPKISQSLPARLAYPGAGTMIRIA